MIFRNLKRKRDILIFLDFFNEFVENVASFCIYWILMNERMVFLTNHLEEPFVLIDCYFERFRNQQLVVAN